MDFYKIFVAGIGTMVMYIFILLIWTPIKWFTNKSQPEGNKIETNTTVIGVLSVICWQLIMRFFEYMHH